MAVVCFGGSYLLEDKYQHDMEVSIDSSADSSDGGLISCSYDTIPLPDWGLNIKSLVGALIVEPSVTTAGGFGLKDSAFMAIQTYGMGFAPVTLDSRGQLGMPCTLWVNLANVNDTLFKRNLRFVIQVLDTSAVVAIRDITSPDGYTVHWELIGRD